MWFTRIPIRNPVFATMMMAACLVLGVFSYQRLAVDQFPVVSVPIVIVQTIYLGHVLDHRLHPADGPRDEERDLLVDFINRDVSEGADRTTAILDAGRVRLRPILMTTFAMVFGVLPLALGLGEGAEQRSPMAHAVIGGIISSTLLTLVVVPMLYSYVDEIGRATARLLRRRGARDVSD